MVCSAKDSVATSYDLCILCGSVGQGQEGKLIPCAQCGQAYHPYCVEVKVIAVLFMWTPLHVQVYIVVGWKFNVRGTCILNVYS